MLFVVFISASLSILVHWAGPHYVYLLIAAAVKVKVDEGESDALTSGTLQPVEAEQVVRVDSGIGGRHQQAVWSTVAVNRLSADCGRRLRSADVVRC